MGHCSLLPPRTYCMVFQGNTEHGMQLASSRTVSDDHHLNVFLFVFRRHVERGLAPKKRHILVGPGLQQQLESDNAQMASYRCSMQWSPTHRWFASCQHGTAAAVVQKRTFTRPSRDATYIGVCAPSRTTQKPSALATIEGLPTMLQDLFCQPWLAVATGQLPHIRVQLLKNIGV